ncbi:transglycosylase SLT domain-containing protein, partial [Streptomyces sp. NPDC005125]
MQITAMPTKFARMTKTKKISLGMVAAGAAVMAGTVVSAPAASAATPAPSGGNVDTWINQSLKVMHEKGIPGTYEGIRKNLMRESSG